MRIAFKIAKRVPTFNDSSCRQGIVGYVIFTAPEFHFFDQWQAEDNKGLKKYYAFLDAVSNFFRQLVFPKNYILFASLIELEHRFEDPTDYIQAYFY